jgi:mutator protein MutT
LTPISARIFARAVLVNQHGKFLIVKNLARNRYEFPGGKQDPGETSAECAFRELKEEVGVTAKSARLCCSASLEVDSGKWRGDFWLVSS